MEIIEDFHWYDYGARFYDPVVARFHTIDPLATDYYFQSPFAYAANNPIRYIDWMGMGPGDSPKLTAVVTIGIQLRGNVRIFGTNVGVSLDAGSIDLVGIRDNKFSFFKNPRRGAGINIGFVGIEYEQSAGIREETKTVEVPVRMENNDNKIEVTEVKEDRVSKTSLTVGFKTNSVENTETKTINDPPSEYSAPTEKVTYENGIGFKAAAGIGLDVSLKSEGVLKEQK